MPWGKSVYTILPLPEDVVTALDGTRRVEGEINDHPINLAIAKAPADIMDQPFLWTGKSLLAEAGIAPGELVEVRLRPARDDVVEIPDGLTDALRASELTGAWETLTPGKRRGLVHQIIKAKRPETRAKRIAKLVEELKEGRSP